MPQITRGHVVVPELRTMVFEAVQVVVLIAVQRQDVKTDR
jgi:hypothetical protein